MKHQEVRVNIWQMIVTSGSYLFLAMCAWVLLRLVNACFWLPGALKKQQAEEQAKLLEEWRLQQSKDEVLDQLPEEQEQEEVAGLMEDDGLHQEQMQEEADHESSCPPETKKTI